MALKLRSPFRSPFVKAETYQGTNPAPISTSLARQGMDSSGNFGPGAPLRPYFGYSQRPRAMDYRVGQNITTSGRAAWGRVSWDTIRGIIGAWDTARACINHKIDELRGMELQFQPADGVLGNVDGALAAARAALAFPDRDLPYESWFSKWMENCLKYDWAPLYKRRNMAGEVIGLEVLDGTTISPFIDENGRRPEAPAPAYWQSVHGIVADWLTADDVYVAPYRPQEDSRYGLAPIESLLITANTSIRFQWHMLQMFTEGSIPAGFMEAPPDLSSPEQVQEWQDFWDAIVLGDQAKQRQLQWVPAGSKFTSTKPDAFDKEFPKYLDLRCAALHGVVGQDINLTDDVNRSTGEVQADTQFRVNTLPWVLYVNGTLTRYLQYDLGLPVQIMLKTGREKADELIEAQTHKLYVDMGAESPDEPRSNVLGLPIDKERPTPRFYNARSGPIPLLSLAGIAGHIDPETYGPAADQPIVYTPFAAPPGVIPQPGSADDAQSLAAENSYQQQLRQELTSEGSQAPVVKGSDVREAELAAFSRFVKARQRAGRWRDFEFTAVDPETAAYLNEQARTQVAPVVLKADAPPEPDPKAPPPQDGEPPAQAWPGWQLDLEAAAYWAPLIASGLLGAVSVDGLVRAFLADHPTAAVAAEVEVESAQDATQELRAEAINWAQRERDAIETALTQALGGLWTDGYLIGVTSADAVVQALETGAPLEAATAETGAWVTGDTEAAKLLLGQRGDGSGLADLLGRFQVQIKSIAQSRLDELGRALADGAARGDSADTIARDITALLSNPSRAQMIATTELCRASSAAAVEGYQGRGYREIEWLTAEDERVCVICDGNEEASPVHLGEPFPSGDMHPPGHPWCRCAAIPVIGSREGD